MRYWTNSNPKSRKTTKKPTGKSKVVRIKWGKGKTTAVTYGRYKRGDKWSYAIKSLDKSRRFTTTRLKEKRHRKYPHTGDHSRRRSRSGFYKGKW
jgi:hypothetical protein